MVCTLYITICTKYISVFLDFTNSETCWTGFTRRRPFGNSECLFYVSFIELLFLGRQFPGLNFVA